MFAGNPAKKLRLEQLERKTPLAADLTGSLLQAELIDGDLVISNIDQNFNVGNVGGDIQTLTITGDNLGNIDILVENADLFDPVSNTTFTDGQTLSLSGFTGGIAADFGSDLAGLPEFAQFALRLEDGLNVGGDISVAGAADSVSFAAVNLLAGAGSFTIDGSVTVTGADVGTYSLAVNAGDVTGDVILDATLSETQPLFDNGGTLTLALAGVTGDVRADLGASTDESNNVRVDGTTIGGDLVVNGGGDTDNVFVQAQPAGLSITPSRIDGRVLIDTAGGDDRVEISDTTVGTAIDIELGEGADTLSLADGQVDPVNINADTTISGAGGNDEITISEFATGDDFLINISSGEDTLLLSGASAPDDLRITSGDGVTAVEVDGSAIGDDVVLNLGEGDDSVSINDTAVDDDIIGSTAGGANSIVVTGSSTVVGDDVMLDGGAGVDEFQVGDDATVTNDIILSGGDGADVLVLEAATVLDDVTIYGGGGDDQIGLAASEIADNLFVFAGSGADEIQAEEFVVGNDFWLFTSGGDDVIEFEGLTVGDDFRALTGAGNDTVAITLANIGDLLLLNTGSGDDEVTLTETTLDVALISLGAGDDYLALGEVTIEDFGLLLDGSGIDTLEDLGGNDFSSAIAVIDSVFEEEIPAA